jgi:hypothetical protein
MSTDLEALPDFLRTLGATHFYHDQPSGIVFAYKGKRLAYLKFGSEKTHTWRRGWYVMRSWVERDDDIPQEAERV